ncbi:MAG TPA: alpha/beta hydrolase [Hanamia sp.]|nr:alpha/beta hydrolase [Hanamia sp.]
MKVRLLLIVIFISLFAFCSVKGQKFIPLWAPNKIPNSKGLNIKDSVARQRAFRVITPGMYAFFPSEDDNCGAAIVIYPGGGYTHITLNLGGFQLAKWFNTLGMSAFVVEYRLPNSPDVKISELAPLQDGQRALQLVRFNAKRWGIDENKIGVMGASAGGHLASWVGTVKGDITTLKDNVDSNSFQPDFMILVSPVIDMGKYAHKGSLESLLGKNPSQELIEKYSTQNNVTTETPPCFIADAFNDKTVPPENSLLFYQALLNKKVSTSFHVFPQGDHSININNNPGSTSLWKDLCSEWLKEMGFISFKK